MQLFFTPNLTHETTRFEFNTDESRHIVKVLRCKEGDILETTNGKGYFFTVRVQEAHPKHCKAKIVQFRRQLNKRYHLHLAVAPTKNSGRYEWFLEKATEIGIHEITPLICSRSERREINAGRMEKILEAAMKQSLRPFLPKLNKAVSVEEFIKHPFEGLKCIAHCEDSEKTDLKRRMGADQDVTILIGPEGDFTRDEIKSAIENGFNPVSLGDARMRTETAAIMAVATVAIINSG
jgi:16S rRNA (uracil1498-N3)-methyltransferase